MSGEDIGSAVAIAVAAIRKASEAVGKTDSGIDDDQIKQMREAIDELETKLNEKKRGLDASRA